MTEVTDNKIVVITGSNRGIGFAIAKELAKYDYSIVLTSRNEKSGEDAIKKIDSNDVLYRPLEITDRDSIEHLVEFVKSRFGKLDILINNAGIIEDEDMILPSSQVPLEVIQRTMDVNFYGTFNLTRAFLPLLKRSKSGKIINISARNGLPRTAFSGWFAYKMSKASINAFTVDLAEELCSSGISVNAVHPGWVASDMGLRVKDLLDQNRENPGPSPQPLEAGINSVTWLLKEENEGVTGKLIIEGQIVEW